MKRTCDTEVNDDVGVLTSALAAPGPGLNYAESSALATVDSPSSDVNAKVEKKEPTDQKVPGLELMKAKSLSAKIAIFFDGWGVLQD